LKAVYNCGYPKVDAEADKERMAVTIDALGGYIASICVGAVGQYLSQFIKPKIKIRYWLFHDFMYAIPNNQFSPPNAAAPVLPPAPNQAVAPAAPPHFFLLTQSVTIQNFGREAAEWVEVVHRQKPDFFQLQPALNFTETVSPTGEHTLRVQSLAPKEFFTIQFLCYTHRPEASLIRSPAGHAAPMPWMIVRRYPRWFYEFMRVMLAAGVVWTGFWIVKGCVLLVKKLGGF
jgi:hypothetical protein